MKPPTRGSDAHHSGYDVSVFTGLIEATAEVLGGKGQHLIVARPSTFGDLRIGSSICVSGVCLTVAALDDRSMTFDLAEETLRRTTLGSLRPGDRLNLERALPASGRFEGHIVQGHVDGVGDVLERGTSDEGRKRKDKQGADVLLTVRYPPSLRGLIVEKGSIAVDGVSLTVARVDLQDFSAVLIPHTLATTTLGGLLEWARACPPTCPSVAPKARRGKLRGAERRGVNLEADILGKYARGVV